MTDPRDELPRFDKPLNGPRRPRVAPFIGVVAVIATIFLIFAVITLLRYHT